MFVNVSFYNYDHHIPFPHLHLSRLAGLCAAAGGVRLSALGTRRDCRWRKRGAGHYVWPARSRYHGKCAGEWNTVGTSMSAHRGSKQLLPSSDPAHPAVHTHASVCDGAHVDCQGGAPRGSTCARQVCSDARRHYEEHQLSSGSCEPSPRV